MITYIKINGFKSFHNFEMQFTPLTFIAGVNASGKSNLFDALKLLARLAEVELNVAFSEQRGNPSELFTRYEEDVYASEMEFIIEMLLARTIKDKWGGKSELKNTRLRYHLKIKRDFNSRGLEDLFVAYEKLEKIKNEEDKWVSNFIDKPLIPLWRFQKSGGAPTYIETTEEKGMQTIKMRQDGKQGGRATPASSVSQTMLSSVNSVEFPHAFAVREEMRNWKFLQLNPDDLREPTRQDVGLKDIITTSGKNLAAVLFRLKQDDEYTLREISRKLNNFLPNFTDVNVYDDKANNQYIIKIKTKDGIEFSSRVLSEGTLRLLALCILQYDYQYQGLLCFEEPENGIHPFRIKSMLTLLKDLSIDFKDAEMPLRQVVVNTHSPTLVAGVVQWQDNRNVSILLSQLSTFIGAIDTHRVNFSKTRMLPVFKADKNQLSLFISENERKLTLVEVAEYLKTADTEKAINSLL